MRRWLASLSCFTLLAAGCNDDTPAGPGPFPTGTSPTSTAPAPPRPRPAPPFAEPFTQIDLEQTIRARVRADDPRCIEWPQWPCKFFRITVTDDGTLDVRIAYSSGNLDVSVNDVYGGEWWDPHPVPGGPHVTLPATRGETYQIVVWEYESPGVEFELRASLRAR